MGIEESLSRGGKAPGPYGEVLLSAARVESWVTSCCDSEASSTPLVCITPERASSSSLIKSWFSACDIFGKYGREHYPLDR